MQNPTGKNVTEKTSLFDLKSLCIILESDATQAEKLTKSDECMIFMTVPRDKYKQFRRSQLELGFEPRSGHM